MYSDLLLVNLTRGPPRAGHTAFDSKSHNFSKREWISSRLSEFFKLFHLGTMLLEILVTAVYFIYFSTFGHAVLSVCHYGFTFYICHRMTCKGSQHSFIRWTPTTVRDVGCKFAPREYLHSVPAIWNPTVYNYHTALYLYVNTVQKERERENLIKTQKNTKKSQRLKTVEIWKLRAESKLKGRR